MLLVKVGAKNILFGVIFWSDRLITEFLTVRLKSISELSTTAQSVTKKGIVDRIIGLFVN